MVVSGLVLEIKSITVQLLKFIFGQFEISNRRFGSFRKKVPLLNSFVFQFTNKCCSLCPDEDVEIIIDMTFGNPSYFLIKLLLVFDEK